MKFSFLLKQMLPGLLPLFVFIAADEIWGTQVGLIVALVFGIAEFIFVYLKSKKADKFILFDTSLLLVLGSISLIFENEIFFKIKPALIEIIFSILIGISAFSEQNILLKMTQRYAKDVQLNEPQVKVFKRNMKILFWIFNLHILLIFYSAFFMSKELWGFISGALIYVIFGIYFLVQILIIKLRKKDIKMDEVFPLVDINGKIIGTAKRSECHGNPELLHPTVHLQIMNKKGDLFMQKRPMHKDTQPGKWDSAVGGHVGLNESIDYALLREASEEVGIQNFSPKFMFRYIWKNHFEAELVYSFLTIYDDSIEINKDELDEGRFWKIEEISNNIGKEIFTPNFEHEFRLYKDKGHFKQSSLKK